MIAFVVVVELAAVVSTALNSSGLPASRDDLVLWGILAAGSVVHLEAVRGIERIREQVRHNTPYVDLKSVWTFASVLVLPALLAVALVVLTFVHQRVRLVRIPLYRCVFTCATVVLATQAASVVLGRTSGLPTTVIGVLVVVLAAAVRWVVNHGLVVAVILLSSPQTSLRTAVGTFSNNIVEVAAVSLGAVTALAAVTQPWFILLIMPTLVVLHRALHQYEIAARTDKKTGLANATHWADTARIELDRADRDSTSVGVLMVDVDHFKDVNDTYGHLTGDAVLAAIANTLRATCRDQDLVGRWGGEEFTVLLPGVSADGVVSVAEHVRRMITMVELRDSAGTTISGLSASIGATTYPDVGPGLEDVLMAADKALYEAKDNGRNTVVRVP